MIIFGIDLVSKPFSLNCRLGYVTSAWRFEVIISFHQEKRDLISILEHVWQNFFTECRPTNSYEAAFKVNCSIILCQLWLGHKQQIAIEQWSVWGVFKICVQIINYTFFFFFLPGNGSFDQWVDFNITVFDDSVKMR